MEISYKTLGVTERRIVSNVIVGNQRFHRRPTLWSRSPSLDLVQLSLDKTIYNIYRLAHPPWTKSSCHSTRRSTTSTLLHHTRVDILDSVVTRNLGNLPNKHGLTFSPRDPLTIISGISIAEHVWLMDLETATSDFHDFFNCIFLHFSKFKCDWF